MLERLQKDNEVIKNIEGKLLLGDLNFSEEEVKVATEALKFDLSEKNKNKNRVSSLASMMGYDDVKEKIETEYANKKMLIETIEAKLSDTNFNLTKEEMEELEYALKSQKFENDRIKVVCSDYLTAEYGSGKAR